MSAYHWEARRRQLMLERRRRNQLLQQKAEASRKMPELRPEINTPGLQPQSPRLPEVTCSCQCCPCKCHYVTRSSAKLPNRYSSVQYVQQW